MEKFTSLERLLFCLRQTGELLKRGDTLPEAMEKLEQANAAEYRNEISAVNSLVQQGSLPTLGLPHNSLLAAANKIFGVVKQQQGDLRATFLGIYELLLQNPQRFNKLLKIKSTIRLEYTKAEKHC